MPEGPQGWREPDLDRENGSATLMVLSGVKNKPRNMGDIIPLREQTDDLHLQKQLVKKYEAPRSVNSTVSEMNTVCSTIHGLRCQVAQQEALIKYTNSQMHNIKSHGKTENHKSSRARYRAIWIQDYGVYTTYKYQMCQMMEGLELDALLFPLLSLSKSYL